MTCAKKTPIFEIFPTLSFCLRALLLADPTSCSSLACQTVPQTAIYCMRAKLNKFNWEPKTPGLKEVSLLQGTKGLSSSCLLWI